MFDKDFLRRLKFALIFFILYTIIFVLFFSTLSYTLPFVIAIIIAMFTNPINRFLIKKVKFSNSIASLVSTIFVFTIILLAITCLIINFTNEARQLLAKLPEFNNIVNYIQVYFGKFELYFNNIDPGIIENLQSQIGSMLSTSAQITGSILSKLVSFAIGLPMVFLIIFITLIATYFFSKDIPNMGIKFLSIFSPEGSRRVKVFYEESNRMLFSYVKAYSLVILMTFVETLLGFSLLKVKYALILSIICAIFDVLPILGIGTIYIPLAGIYLLSKNYFMGIAIIVLYILVTAIRQVVEPKLVSSSLGLHPVAVLAAIFIGIKAYGFIGMIYLIFLMVFYNILRKVYIS